MRELKVYVEIQGIQRFVGKISGNSYQDAVFQYDRSYMDASFGSPISVSLPFQEEAFSPEKTGTFFESLLPEGFSRRAVAQWAKSDEKDYLSLLAGLGRECLGALRIAEDDNDRTECYEKLSAKRIRELAAEGATRSTEILMQTHLSLTGASGKAGLYYDREHDSWYLPKGEAPSSHIVKQSHVRLSQIVLNEQLCMLTAKNLGLSVPDSFIVDLERGRDEDVLFATARFDRVMGKGRRIDGLIAPLRLHQEDFAQALGIPAEQKYEKVRQGYLGKMFRLLQTFSADPIADREELLRRIVFDYLIGNTDCHIKNFSLLYDPDLRFVRLAPAYDIVAARVYHMTDEMSFFIGDTLSIDKIRRSSFLSCSEEIGFGKRMTEGIFDKVSDGFEEALDRAADTLCGQGFEEAKKLQRQILQTGGYAQI
ncbi:MAG: HipA domain-containing protein [Lachnospiraceae bacterium]|nr:HipA domain-containing protein [Lachnospiraceae bacterium]